MDSEQFDRLFEKLDEMQKKIDSMNKEIQEIKRSAGKMDNHIDFIETIYDTIKTPFHYAFRVINKTIPKNYIENENSLTNSARSPNQTSEIQNTL